MLQARALMIPETPTLSFDTTVPQAIEHFKSSPSSFAVVRASPERLHGVLTEASLVQVYLKYKNDPDRESLILYRNYFEPAQLIHEHEEFTEVVKKLMTAVGHRLFVINSAGALVGHITAKHILPFFSQPGAETHRPSKELQSQMMFFESFFSQSPFMMHSVNHDGHIQMANQMLHAVLGYEYGELIGKTIFDLYPKENHQKAQAGIKTIFSQGYHQIVHGKMLHKSGRQIEIELVSRALEDSGAKPIGTITVSRPLDMKILLEALPNI